MPKSVGGKPTVTAACSIFRKGSATCWGSLRAKVTYEEFGKMITPAYREYALASIGVRGGAERLYPLQGAEGEIWCYWKLLREEVADDGGMLLTGYFRVVDPPSEVVNSQEKATHQ